MVDKKTLYFLKNKRLESCVKKKKRQNKIKNLQVILTFRTYIFLNVVHKNQISLKTLSENSRPDSW